MRRFCHFSAEPVLCKKIEKEPILVAINRVQIQKAHISRHTVYCLALCIYKTSVHCKTSLTWLGRLSFLFS